MLGLWVEQQCLGHSVSLLLGDRKAGMERATAFGLQGPEALSCGSRGSLLFDNTSQHVFQPGRWMYLS